MRSKKNSSGILVFPVILILLFFISSCGPRWKNVELYKGREAQQRQATTTVRKMGYTIQVGAFAKVSNAAGLTKSLEKQGLNAFYYHHKSGLYKVRFGNYETLAKARSEASRLQKLGIIDVVYIVNPSEYTISRTIMLAQGGKALRNELVNTAQTYIGLPYQWGASTINGPNDCSGLVMAVYELNGLNVPRTSGEQYEYGIRIDKEDLKKGDLVFFSTNGPGRVSHVGIYIGDDKFIHAPGTGKTIREESLSREYYSNRFYGACTYLR